MFEVIDLTGQIFGRLTVIQQTGFDKHRNALWLCKCICGKEKIIRGHNLRQGMIKSCGCLHKEIVGNKNRLKSGLSSMHQAMKQYKNNAKRRGYKFELTEEQFEKLTQKDCYYCNTKPNNITKNIYNNGNYIYNGIDRLDNTKSYTIENVVSCCKTCNLAKHTLTTQEFKDWIKKVYKNYILGDD